MMLLSPTTTSHLSKTPLMSAASQLHPATEPMDSSHYVIYQLGRPRYGYPSPHFHQRVHLTKLIHDILPMNDNVSRWKTLCLENVPLAHTPEKTATMFFAAPTLLEWNGNKSFLSISEQHVTNCILILTYKSSYSQLWKPGLPTPQLNFLSTPLSILTSFDNKHRSAGVRSSMDV
jgi:hypothetical protein